MLYITKEQVHAELTTCFLISELSLYTFLLTDNGINIKNIPRIIFVSAYLKEGRTELCYSCWLRKSCYSQSKIRLLLCLFPVQHKTQHVCTILFLWLKKRLLILKEILFSLSDIH